jgi:hypothetical protein
MPVIVKMEIRIKKPVQNGLRHPEPAGTLKQISLQGNDRSRWRKMSQ